MEEDILKTFMKCLKALVSLYILQHLAHSVKNSPNDLLSMISPSHTKKEGLTTAHVQIQNTTTYGPASPNHWFLANVQCIIPKAGWPSDCRSHLVSSLAECFFPAGGQCSMSALCRVSGCSDGRESGDPASNSL
jgi:hypothetical protein